MKNVFYLLIVIGNLFFIACESENSVEGTFPPIKSGMENKEDCSTWQEQLEYARKQSLLQPLTKSNIDKINCVDYRKVGIIDSESKKQEIIESLFDENAVTVRNIGGFNYEIVSVKTILEDGRLLNDEDPFIDVKNDLDSLVDIGMELIEIEWSYKGGTYYSLAIASNERGGIIYDNIGFLMLERIESISTPERMYGKKVVSKSVDIPGRRIYYDCRRSDIGYNNLNVRVWSYDIYCEVVGLETNEGSRIMIDRSMSAEHSNAAGWSCDARIEEIEFITGEGGYLKYVWAYAYGAKISVSLVYNGLGFEFPLGSTGASGSEYVSLYELN